jgi:hypothetical protein
MAVTWDTIRQQFNDDDINHMKEVKGDAWDLGDCKAVWQYRKEIWSAVSNKRMPPNDPWPQEWLDNFEQWMKGLDPGCPTS